MSEHPDNLVVAMLRGIHGILDDHGRKLGEVVSRLGAVERGLADLRRDTAELHIGLAAVNTRLDNLDRRVARIEQRLDLADDPALPPVGRL